MTIDVPDAWTASRDTDTTWLLERRNGGLVDATMAIDVEVRRSHAEAVQQLAAIETGYDAPVAYATNAGWPSLERKVRTAIKSPDPERTSQTR